MSSRARRDVRPRRPAIRTAVGGARLRHKRPPTTLGRSSRTRCGPRAELRAASGWDGPAHARGRTLDCENLGHRLELAALKRCHRIRQARRSNGVLFSSPACRARERRGWGGSSARVDKRDTSTSPSTALRPRGRFGSPSTIGTRTSRPTTRRSSCRRSRQRSGSSIHLFASSGNAAVGQISSTP